MIGAAAAALLLLGSKRGSVYAATLSAQSKWIPVRFGDDKLTLAPGQVAKWHPTIDQTKLFGPRFPSFWSMNGFFAFDNGSGGFDKYKPDWQVPIKMGTPS